MNSRPNRSLRRNAAVLVALLLGCSGERILGPDPPGTVRPEEELNFIALPTDHPPFFQESVTFYARVGRNVSARIHFATPSGDRGRTFARLDIGTNSLLARPDGTPFEPDDSVLIVMKVADQSRFLVEMEPGGLRFSPDDPARLRIDYESTRGDLNGNGRRDKDDDQIDRRLGIWVQETLFDPYVKVGTARTQGIRELDARLESFSRFAIAY